MQSAILIALTFTVSGVLAAPRVDIEASTTTTAVMCTSSSAPITSPTAPFTVISAHSASNVHLLPWTASGLRFYLGGTTATYCPGVAGAACLQGNVSTAMRLCGMDTIVPGGQQIYIAPDGSIGYKQAHSASTPQGAILCPFTYEKAPSDQLGILGLNPVTGFGATGFMGCPTDLGIYQVFGALENATVPRGNVSECIGFDALTLDYSGPTAWQYT